MRRAMMVCGSMPASRVGDEIVDDGRRRHDVVGRDHADRNDVVGAGDDGVGRHRDHRIEVAGGQRVARDCRDSPQGMPAPARSRRAARPRADSSCRRPRSLLAVFDRACRCRSASGCRPARSRRRGCARSACLAAPARPPSRRPSSAAGSPGLRPMWLTIALRTSLAAMSLPMPLPGHRGVVGDHGEIALVLAHDLVDRPARAFPRAMKPPIIRLAPSGIMATDCSRETVCMCPASRPLLRGPAAIDRQRRAADLRGGIGAQEDRQRTDLLGRGEFMRRLLFGQQIGLCLIDARSSRAAPDRRSAFRPAGSAPSPGRSHCR